MSGAKALDALARRLLPAGYGCAVLPLAAEPAPLLPEEAGAIARAVPKRRREFALGRMALRAAIRQAGHDLPATRPIAARADRQPDLPPGIRASLSHGGDYCIAIAAPPGGASVGIDLEPCDRSVPEGLAETIMPFRLRGPKDALLAFCAKEAMFKAQYPLTGRMLDFRAVPAVIGPRRFRACMGDRLIGGRWGQAAGYWLALSLWSG
ncbi:4-phosphopantetheinyl transferase [Paracoccus sp. SSJ]|uniref:4'-phosphopantetheinyl transferase family protein n=1 Tax=Paracoccus sp. SSJ TaxID=3050636 RepID=UPI00254F3026|nr:4-phosphopantetheinyl transferase [Paracoccus sp. SSJ]MDK8873495.1 4-phosphopantetheinyl transferase [Paracoccus sp. SSJ]